MEWSGGDEIARVRLTLPGRKLFLLKTVITRGGRVRLLINGENNVCQSFWLSQQLEQIAR